MNDYIKINEEYKPVTYVVRPQDPFWELRKSIEVTVESTYAEIKELFKGGEWKLYEKVTKQVPDEPTDGDEVPASYHDETEYVEQDMSEYCVCGYVKDNMDGTVSVKMGVLSELESFMATMLGGI